MDACFRIDSAGSRTGKTGWEIISGRRYLRLHPSKLDARTGLREKRSNLHRHLGYRKEHNKMMPLIRLKFRDYPALVKNMDERHIQYNRMLDKIAYLEKEGRIHVIRPDRDISAKVIERDPAELKKIYDVGRKVMKADMEKLKAYLEK